MNLYLIYNLMCKMIYCLLFSFHCVDWDYILVTHLLSTYHSQITDLETLFSDINCCVSSLVIMLLETVSLEPSLTLQLIITNFSTLKSSTHALNQGLKLEAWCPSECPLKHFLRKIKSINYTGRSTPLLWSLKKYKSWTF